MRRFCKHIVLLGGWLLWAGGIAGQNSPIIAYVDSNEVHLRWAGVHQAGVEGYFVYRQAESGAWQKLNTAPLKLVTENKEIRDRLGFKADLFLALFGIEQENADISPAAYRELIGDPEAVSFMEAISIVNPEFGNVLGESYVDGGLAGGQKLRYRVTCLIGGNENDLGISAWVETGERQTMPKVEGIRGSGGDQRAALAWQREDDLMAAGEIVSWNIYRASSVLGPYQKVNPHGLLFMTVSSGDTPEEEAFETHVDRFLANGQKYFYQVRAVNAFGFEGPPSRTVEIIPGTDLVPRPPYALKARLLGSNVELSWKSRPDSIRGFEVYRAIGEAKEFQRVYPLADVLLTPQTQFLDLQAVEGESHFYYVRAISAFGTPGRTSDTLAIRYQDLSAPAAPTGLEARAEPGVIFLCWEKGKENDLLGYQLERAGAPDLKITYLLNGPPISETDYVDSIPRDVQTPYGYFLYALDEHYNRSEAAHIVVQPKDLVPPLSPLIKSLEQDGLHLRLTWTEGRASDLASYKVWLRKEGENPESWSLAGVSGAPEIDLTLDGIGRYALGISAVDSSGNDSERGETVWVEIRDGIPLPPEKGSVAYDDGKVELHWAASASSFVKGYLITREDEGAGGEVEIATRGKEERSFSDGYVRMGKTYTYRIYARNVDWEYASPLELKIEIKKGRRK